MTYENQLNILGLTTLKTRRNRGDLIEVYKLFHGFYDIDPLSVFQLKIGDRTRRNHNLTIYKQKVKTEVVRRSFQYRVVELWNSLDKHIVNAPSLNTFQNRLDIKLVELRMF